MTRRHCPAGVFVKEQRGRRGNSVQRHFTVAAALHFPQIIYRLMVQNQLAIAVKLAPFTVFAGDRFHLLTPFLWGMWWFSPFPPIERMESLWLPAKCLLFSLFRNFFLRRIAGRRKQQNSPGRSKTHRAKQKAICSFPTWYSTYAQPLVPAAGGQLFLTG